MQQEKTSGLLLTLSPFVLFFLLFIGSGIYLSLHGEKQAFYQVSASVAILPAIILAFFLIRAPMQKTLNVFLEGTRDRNIIVMCLIYLLAGAFATVLQTIGGVTSVVNIILNVVPTEAIIPALFLVAALVSTAMGTSMGTIAALGPIGVGIANSAGLPLPLTLGAVVSGAMFGDNLSIISDTSIAATQIHGCTAMEKFKSNIVVAIPAMIATLIVLSAVTYHIPNIQSLPYGEYQIAHCIPYLAVLVLAVLGMNVFSVLLIGIFTAGIIGILTVPEYTIFSLSKNIFEGYKNMAEILILSLLIGGLGALIKHQGGFAKMAALLAKCIPEDPKSAKVADETIENQETSLVESRTLFHHTHPKAASGAIASIVSITDICTANNTVSIILSGESVREIALQNKLKPAETATLVDLFSCVFQGLLPYGAQLLMAGALAGISPLSIAPHVHYCYLLGLAGVIAIFVPIKGIAIKRWTLMKG